MKFSINEMIGNCAADFMRTHPELAQKYSEALSNMLTDKERSYAMLGIEFAIRFMVETIAMKQKDAKTERTTFE